MTTYRALLVAGCLAIGPAAAETYTLPDAAPALKPGHGQGFEAAQANCLTCHSVDYIATQPPKQGRTFWEAEVTKMIKVYHAPIEEADAKAITEYLTETY